MFNSEHVLLFQITQLCLLEGLHTADTIDDSESQARPTWLLNVPMFPQALYKYFIFFCE